MGEVILTMKDIDKSFPGVHALDHVNFEVKRGEVHALMGENGAGKSTLMKVLTGIYQKDSGSITYKGKETEFHNTREAQDAGVVIVHQELNMVGDLTGGRRIGQHRVLEILHRVKEGLGRLNVRLADIQMIDLAALGLCRQLIGQKLPHGRELTPLNLAGKFHKKDLLGRIL